MALTKSSLLFQDVAMLADYWRLLVLPCILPILLATSKDISKFYHPIFSSVVSIKTNLAEINLIANTASFTLHRITNFKPTTRYIIQINSPRRFSFWRRTRIYISVVGQTIVYVGTWKYAANSENSLHKLPSWSAFVFPAVSGVGLKLIPWNYDQD